MNRLLSIRSLLLFVLAVSGLAVLNSEAQPDADGHLDTETQRLAVAQLEALSDAFRAVHEIATPTVVLIQTSGDWEPRLPQWHRRIQPPEDVPAPTGMGSGVIISSDGYIISNYHVIRDADTIEVVFRDRRRLAAEV
ncbi:MAG: hypothetical protein HOC05_02095, partial [Gemmatimonadetes bacterium]|nr:hypothetical protein [Gemmatimonadota bacterium]